MGATVRSGWRGLLCRENRVARVGPLCRSILKLCQARSTTGPRMRPPDNAPGRPAQGRQQRGRQPRFSGGRRGHLGSRPGGPTSGASTRVPRPRRRTSPPAVAPVSGVRPGPRSGAVRRPRRRALGARRGRIGRLLPSLPPRIHFNHMIATVGDIFFPGRLHRNPCPNNTRRRWFVFHAGTIRLSLMPTFSLASFFKRPDARRRNANMLASARSCRSSRVIVPGPGPPTRPPNSARSPSSAARPVAFRRSTPTAPSPARPPSPTSGPTGHRRRKRVAQTTGTTASPPAVGGDEQRPRLAVRCHAPCISVTGDCLSRPGPTICPVPEG